VNYKLKAGELIGTVGNDDQRNFDFGVRDYRTTLNYANPSRYSLSSRSIVCPYEYFDSQTKNELIQKLARSEEPKCGVVSQDIEGTLQGNWFQGKVDFTDWYNHLAFVYDNEHPSRAVISIGGIFTEAKKWQFIPEESETFNRKFSDITPDGNIYCFEGDDPNRSGESKPEGKIIVQLTSETELKIEHQDGSCTLSSTFRNPTIYNR